MFRSSGTELIIHIYSEPPRPRVKKLPEHGKNLALKIARR